MYLWNVNGLVEDFREERVTEHHQLSYLLFSVVLYTVLFDTYLDSFWWPIDVSFYDMLMLPVSLVVGVGGTVLCYRAMPLERRGFLSRYVCIGIPVGIRVLVFVFGGIIGLVVVSELLGLSWMDEVFVVGGMSFWEFVVLSGVQVYFFWYLRQAIHASYGEVKSED